MLDYLEPKHIGPLNQRNENHGGHMFQVKLQNAN